MKHMTITQIALLFFNLLQFLNFLKLFLNILNNFLNYSSNLALMSFIKLAIMWNKITPQVLNISRLLHIKKNSDHQISIFFPSHYTK